MDKSCTGAKSPPGSETVIQKKGGAMDPLTELLTGLGRHYGLVLVGCAELIAALFLLG